MTPPPLALFSLNNMFFVSLGLGSPMFVLGAVGDAKGFLSPGLSGSPTFWRYQSKASTLYFNKTATLSSASRMAKNTWRPRHILSREPPARGWKKYQNKAQLNEMFFSILQLSMCNTIPHTCNHSLCLSVLVHHCFFKGLQKVRQKCVKSLQNSPKTGQ